MFVMDHFGDHVVYGEVNPLTFGVSLGVVG